MDLESEKRSPGTADDGSAAQAEPTRTSVGVLNRLPFVYYCLGIIVGMCGLYDVLIHFLGYNEELEFDTQMYVFITALSLFTVGRAIDLLQQIRDK